VPLVEAGPLRIFRLLAGLQLGVALVTAFVFLTHIHSGEYHSTGQLLFMLTATALLFGYVRLPQLDRRLGAVHLPLAIAMSLAAPILGQVLVAYEGHPFAQYVGVSGEMQLFALFPLLAVAWRYRFRVAAALAIGTGLAEFGLTRLAYPDEAGSVEYGRLLFTRTLGYLAVGYIVNRLMAAQRAGHAALRAANANLARYAATLEDLAVSRERGRLARELHDTLAHTLSGLAIQLEGIHTVWDAEPHRARALLESALAGTRSGLAETRRALGDLRAAPLAEWGLVEAVRRFAEAASKRCGARLSLDLAPPPAGLPLPIEQTLYRVAQEALENVVGHARAGHLWVHLGVLPERLELTVRDDGCGFDPVTVDDGRHLGLRGLRERARVIEARLDVTSRPGAGTTVALALDRDPAWDQP
jgi:signal transduction histidine kinase